jgi:KaiC/GvpD/RAD55 family RecA-like ATPase
VPDGIPYPSSILLSGPSGTGKPFVGLAIAAAWLKQGGSVIFVPMHSSYPALYVKGLRELLDADLKDFDRSHFFVLFDTELDAGEAAVEKEGDHAVRANLANPLAWRAALEAASAALEGKGPTLVFTAATNLLLFSPNYGPQMFQLLVDTIRDPGDRTYLFAMSSSILRKRGIVLEQAADHLFVMERLPKKRHLYLRAARVRDAVFAGDPVPVPAEPGFLEELKNEAVASRRLLIPAVGAL